MKKSTFIPQPSTVLVSVVLLAVSITASGQISAPLGGFSAGDFVALSKAQQLAAACTFNVVAYDNEFPVQERELAFEQPPQLSLVCSEASVSVLGDATLELRRLTSGGKVSTVFARKAIANSALANGESDRFGVDLSALLPKQNTGDVAAEYSLALVVNDNGRARSASTVF
ncbi:MAG: hypothetical protein AAFX85_21105, partial [Pseudomonadota bacterium]